jgi:hypothetical protein
VLLDLATSGAAREMVSRHRSSLLIAVEWHRYRRKAMVSGSMREHMASLDAALSWANDGVRLPPVEATADAQLAKFAADEARRTQGRLAWGLLLKDAGGGWKEPRRLKRALEVLSNVSRASAGVEQNLEKMLTFMLLTAGVVVGHGGVRQKQVDHTR